MAQRMGEFNDFMTQFMQLLVQQKLEKDRADLWLQKSLKEYGAWEESQKRVMLEGLIRDVFDKQFGAAKEWAGDQPYSPYEVNRLIRNILPENIRGRIPELQAPGSPTAAAGSMADLIGAMGAGEHPSEETLKGVLPAYGFEEAMDVAKKVQSGKEERARLGMREKELEIDKKRIEQEWSRLNQQIKEFNKESEEDKKGEKKDEILDSYKSLADLYDDQIEMLRSALDNPQNLTEGGASEIQRKIDSLVNNKERLIKKVEKLVDVNATDSGELSIEEARALYIKTLIEKGVPREAAENLARQRFGGNG